MSGKRRRTGWHGREVDLQKDPFYCAKMYQENGLHILPLLPGRKMPKHAWAQYRERFMSDEEMWEEFSLARCNIGIVTGPESNLTVIDCDSRNEAARFKEMCPKDTPCVITARGAHFYFRHTEGEKNGVQLTLKDCTFDIRGEGGFVVAPPSIVKEKPYRWLEPLKATAALYQVPGQVRNMLVAQVKDKHRFEKLTLPQLKDGVRTGGRDNALTSICGELLHHGHSEDFVVLMTRAANAHFMDPPLPDGQVDRILRSIISRHRSRR